VSWKGGEMGYGAGMAPNDDKNKSRRDFARRHCLPYSGSRGVQSGGTGTCR
jgi:hypothetical protein